LSAREAKKSLFEITDASFGSIPAAAIRVFFALLAMLWMGQVGSLVSNLLRFSFDLSLAKSSLASAGLALFLVASGVQGSAMTAKLTRVTNKLGIAMLIAAAIRVRGYLPWAWSDLGVVKASHGDYTLWLRVAEPLMFIGPLAFLAADFGRRSGTRKNVVLMGAYGIAIPMAATLFAVSLIQRAAYYRRSDLGGLASIMVALWDSDSKRYVGWWMMLALITLFGLARFCAGTAEQSLLSIITDRKIRLTALAIVAAAAAVLGAKASTVLLGWSAPSARIASPITAILSADYLVKGPRPDTPRRLDWLALIALVAGWIASVQLSSWAGEGYESHLAASILTPYLVSFVVFLTGRLVQRRMIPAQEFKR
jgi:hypothetical protein